MEFILTISKDELIRFHGELSCSNEKPSQWDHIQNLEGLLSNHFSDFRVETGN